MNAENTKKLLADFPEFWKHINDIGVSLVAFGFECGDGWFDLIYQLCRDVQATGWGQDDGEYVTQVKEKYGELRFYVSSATDKVFDLISDAENESCKICERCGEIGRLRGDFWITCLCDECFMQEV